MIRLRLVERNKEREREKEREESLFKSGQRWLLLLTIFVPSSFVRLSSRFTVIELRVNEIGIMKLNDG